MDDAIQQELGKNVNLDDVVISKKGKTIKSSDIKDPKTVSTVNGREIWTQMMAAQKGGKAMLMWGYVE